MKDTIHEIAAAIHAVATPVASRGHGIALQLELDRFTTYLVGLGGVKRALMRTCAKALEVLADHTPGADKQ